MEVSDNLKMSARLPARVYREKMAAVSRPTLDGGQSKSGDLNYVSVTAADCNAGSTPLGAWLNQSVMPSIILSEVSQPEKSDAILVRREHEESEVFRKIQIKEAAVEERRNFSDFSVLGKEI